MTRAIQLLAALALLSPVAMYAQHTHQAAGKPPKMTDAQKIKNAMGAAPTAIAIKATIMDWPDDPTGQPKQLRAGTNGWVCYPNSPQEFQGAAVNDPMCLDKQWQDWAQAWMSKTTPKVTATGIAYMLQGDKGASNTDPFATGPAANNEWVVAPSHIMVLFPDTKALDAYPTDPKTGGPWVMWKGTPYAHLMVPVSVTKGAIMPPK
jgi:hypothetical protein